MTSSTRQLRTEFADGSRLRWEFGNEEIGDRTPSQYAVISAIREEMRQLQARINALSIDSRRRARSRSPRRYHRRSRSRDSLCYYHAKCRERARECRFPCTKRVQPPVNAPNVDGFGTRRIFIRDRRTNIAYLINTGADTCVYPRNKIREPANKGNYKQFAAN